MANPKHLEILNRGVERWNTWRNEHRSVLPNLSKADLRKADLSGARLNGVDFSEADLTGADLSEADLIRADLAGARLHRANLIGADLGATDLAGTDLSGADLRGAILYGANISDTNLTGANLSEARAGSTNFADVDLSVAKGLGTIEHDVRSTIGIDTIYRSRGKIPEAFLRGCGVPDEFIVYIRSLAGRRLKFASCFISYSNRDQKFAKRLYADLQAHGVRCWLASEDLKIGEKFQEKIEESIRLHDKLLLVLSKNSVLSPWVEREVQAALERECRSNKLVLFPIRLGGAVMEASKAWAADIRRTRHIGEFGNWREPNSYKKALERLLRDLKAESATALAG
jgi:hypothetical protein